MSYIFQGHKHGEVVLNWTVYYAITPTLVNQLRWFFFRKYSTSIYGGKLGDECVLLNFTHILLKNNWRLCVILI